LNIYEQAEFNSFIDSLKVNPERVEFSESGSLDIVSIYPQVDSKISKLEKNLKQIGLMLKAKTEPLGYYDYKSGCFKVTFRKRELESRDFKDFDATSSGEIPILLGLNADGTTLQPDLSTIPNLIIGGVPGSGKSMLLHSIVISMLRSDTNIHLCDPKLVEFSKYSGIKNVMTISLNNHELEQVLNHLTKVMNARFEKYKSSGCSNIKEYRARKNPSEKYECLVVDEWADVVLSNPKIADQVVSLAQKGRAAGISLILATQRPSSKVFPGLVKASFSGKIALRTSNSMESRIIIDKAGAENLSEVGSAIFSSPNHQDVVFRSPRLDDVSGIISKHKPSSFFDMFGLSRWKI
jgi:DNA segregation ATPase FtsK/SpoIIIE-like protein